MKGTVSRISFGVRGSQMYRAVTGLLLTGLILFTTIQVVYASYDGSYDFVWDITCSGQCCGYGDQFGQMDYDCCTGNGCDWLPGCQDNGGSCDSNGYFNCKFNEIGWYQDICS